MSQSALTVVEPSQTAFDHAQLPKGWQWARLGDLCDFVRGVSFDKGEVKTSPTFGHIPILRAGNIGKKLDTANDLIWIPSQNVSQEQRFREKDIAICMSSGSPSVVGKTAQLEEPFEGSVGAFCGIIRAHSVKHADYLAHWLRSPSYEGWRDSQTRGANIQNLRFSEFASILLPLPPPSELSRIVAILKEQLAAVERARAATEAQLKAAREMPDAYRRTVFADVQSQGYQFVKLGDISSLIIDGPHVTPMYVPKGVPFVTVRNIVNRRVDLSQVSYITEADHAEFTRRGKAEKGDILYTKDGATLGIPCVVDTDEEFSFFVSVALIKLIRERADSRFVAYAMESPFALKQVELLSAGAGIKHMVLRSIRALEVPLPPMPKQREIAAALNEQMLNAEQVRKILEDQLDSINKLPAALLRQAFTGKL